MRAFLKRGGWSFRTGISMKGWKLTMRGRKIKKRKERRNFVQKLCIHTVNGHTNKH